MEMPPFDPDSFHYRIRTENEELEHLCRLALDDDESTAEWARADLARLLAERFRAGAERVDDLDLQLSLRAAGWLLPLLVELLEAAELKAFEVGYAAEEAAERRYREQKRLELWRDHYRQIVEYLVREIEYHKDHKMLPSWVDRNLYLALERRVDPPDTESI